MKVAIPSTPKQYFHLLVDQVHQKIPLVIFTPKALLRNPLCKSPFDELSSSAFETLIDDGNQKAKVLVLCYGKIYFDLKKIQDEKNLDHISVVRVEQLYPLDVEKLEQIKSQKKELQKIVLVQDEPLNMGAYTYLKAQLETLAVISRKQASSPATGFYQLHEKQYQDILTQFENL
jgi:2-oxoglutarate dehydrogenase E1 component